MTGPTEAFDGVDDFDLVVARSNMVRTFGGSGGVIGWHCVR
jgi:hypothetical protein